MNIDEIIRLIESKRLSNKLHKAKLCKAAGISAQYYNKLLEGGKQPAFTVICGLLRALNLRLAVIDGHFGVI